MIRRRFATGPAFIAAGVFTCASIAGPLRFVDPDAPPGGNGQLWASAYNDLQTALADAEESAGAVQAIRLAEGVYKPDGPDGDIFATFNLPAGVSLLGGFAGVGAEDPNLRDPERFVTILSGDLNGNDGPIVDTDDPSRLDNVAAVLTIAIGSGALIDGVTITSGNGLGLDGGGVRAVGTIVEFRNCRFTSNAAERGGAAFFDSTDVRLFKCAFDDNAANDAGGAVFNGNGCTTGQCELRVEYCAFDANRATGGPDGEGGAIWGGGCPVIVGSTFTGNEASAVGGAVWLEECATAPPQILQSVFIDNHADVGGAVAEFDDSLVVDSIFLQNTATERGGGAVSHRCSEGQFVNCLFAANDAGETGGGAAATNLSFAINCQPLPGVGPDYINCTFADNDAPSGAALFVANGDIDVTNSILWANSGGGAAIEFVPGREAFFRHTLIEGGVPVIGGVDLGGNLNADPLFVTDDPGAFLLAQIPLQPETSPAVDAGLGPADGSPLALRTTRTDQGLDVGVVDLGFHYAVDCNENGVVDQLEVACGDAPDCNNNFVPDGCDIDSGFSSDCNGNDIPDECELSSTEFGGPVILGGDDADDHGHFDPEHGNEEGWLYIEEGFNLIGPSVGNFNTQVVCLGCKMGEVMEGFESGFDLSVLAGAGWTRVSLAGPQAIDDFFNNIGDVRLIDTAIVYMPTDSNNAVGGITTAEILAVADNAEALNLFVLSGGGLFTHDQRNVAGGFAWLSALLPDLELSPQDCNGDPQCDDNSLQLTEEGELAFPNLTNEIISNATPWHSWFGGDLGGLVPLVEGPVVIDGEPQQRPVILGGQQVLIFSSDCNANDIPDECDITSGVSLDINNNNVPDECEATCLGDLDFDAVVDAGDLAALLAAWSTDPLGPPDFDGDGDVNAADLAILLAAWGECPAEEP